MIATGYSTHVIYFGNYCCYRNHETVFKMFSSFRKNKSVKALWERGPEGPLSIAISYGYGAKGPITSPLQEQEGGLSENCC